MSMNYLDFELEIGAGEGRDYAVSVRSPVGEVLRVPTVFPFTDAELENYLLRLENAILRSAGQRRQALSEDERAVRNFGQSLFDFALSGDARGLYYTCKLEAAHRGQGVRLKLHIRPPLLATLPWEFLFDPRLQDFVRFDAHTPLVRYLDLAQVIQPLAVSPPLRILGMVASPSNLQPHLDVQQEIQRVERVVAGLRQRGLVELTWLEGQTWSDLQRAMRTTTGVWHVFHFIGHGGFDTARDEGVIMLADAQGLAHRISAGQLNRLLAGQRHTLRLVVLNACEGARGGVHDVVSSTAATLVRGGIPAVLAMQYAITDAAAVQFASTFYDALADGLPVDTAVTEARNAINLEDERSLEWGTPVLTMRAPDGRIFDLERVQATLRPQRQPVEQAIQPGMEKEAVERESAPQELSTVLADLRNILAYLYSDETSARRVAADAGLDERRIAFSSRAADNWHAILREAVKANRMSVLLDVVLADYGENRQLRTASAAYRAAANIEPAPAAPSRRQVEDVSTKDTKGHEAGKSTATPPQRQVEASVPIAFDWATIPAGEFVMGSEKAKDSAAYDDELPQHRFFLPEYRIARVPVTVEQFGAFAKATGHKTTAESEGWAYNWTGYELAKIEGAYWARPRGPQSDVSQKANHPVTCISWHDANAFCAWAGVRMPSEAEWEKAARGTDGRIYPWGNDPPNEKRCNFNMNVGDTTPVDAYPAGASPYGCMDTAGNVWEWCSTKWLESYADYQSKVDDKPGGDAPRVVRGGTFVHDPSYVRCAVRNRSVPNLRSRYFGFRVASPGL